MNALFLDGDGNVFDPMGGLADLRAGRVRFVGDAETRIREDVLRLLRFYRFHAHYGRGEADPSARAACRALAHLLPTLSGERVAAETLKLLAAPTPLPALQLMVEDGVLGVLLPEARSLDLLAALVPLEPAPQPRRRLAALIDGPAEAVAARLRLSNEQRDRLAVLAPAPRRAVDLAADERAQRRALHRLGADAYGDLVLLRAAAAGDAAPVAGLLALAASWQPVTFPLKGRDVTGLGVPVGPEVGSLLKEVEAWWEDGDYRADRAACLDELKRRVAGS
jgi:poly(A) polymerase